jgi:hypothetical protein
MGRSNLEALPARTLVTRTTAPDRAQIAVRDPCS